MNSYSYLHLYRCMDGKRNIMFMYDKDVGYCLVFFLWDYIYIYVRLLYYGDNQNRPLQLYSTSF
jgi:hypothetical protein